MSSAFADVAVLVHALEYGRHSGLGTEMLRESYRILNMDTINGLGMDALEIVCSRKHGRAYGLGTDALRMACSRQWGMLSEMEGVSWFGHGCSGNCMLWEALGNGRYYGLGRDALDGHGRSGNRMLSNTHMDDSILP